MKKRMLLWLFEAARADWYKRLAEAAEAATQVVALDAGAIPRLGASNVISHCG